MSVTKRPPAKKTPDKAIADFIASAPDSSPVNAEKKKLMRGKREQISHTITPALLERLDKQVELSGMTRAGLINHAIGFYLDSMQNNK